MSVTKKIAIVTFFLWFSSILGCAVTPLPVPPTVEPEVNPDLITIAGTEGGVSITGAEGAIEPAESEIRITTIIPVDSVPELVAFEEVVTDDDGSFSVVIGGADATAVFYVEFLLEEGDLFVMAIAAGEGGVAVEAEPGVDSDDDGSPDIVDCAPMDETYRGRECP